MRKVSVVIPAYNEQDNIPILYEKLKRVLESMPYDYEIIFVNDGSSDATLEKMMDIALKDPKVTVIDLARNFGQTPAMMAGIDKACGDVIVTMDADLQNDPEDIPKLIEKINEGFDIVSGWRKDRKDSASRVLPSKVANWLIGVMTGVKLHDYGCTLKAYRANVLKNVRLYGEMHRFIPALAATVTSPDRIVEIPVRHHPRKYGKSKYGMSRTLKVLADLIFVWFINKFMQKPIHFFGIIGIILFTLGSVSFGYLAVLKVLGHSIGGRPLLIVSVLLIIAGLQMITTGILGEILVRIYYESQGKKPYVIRDIFRGRC